MLRDTHTPHPHSYTPHTLLQDEPEPDYSRVGMDGAVPEQDRTHEELTQVGGRFHKLVGWPAYLPAARGQAGLLNCQRRASATPPGHPS